MLTKRLSTSATSAANKPEWHKTAFRTSMIQIWSRLVKVLKPVPAVAGYKPLCFLKYRETQPRPCTAGTNTHGEDFLRLPTRSHVDVVDLFEDHPSFVVLPHLTGGGQREREREGVSERERERAREREMGYSYIRSTTTSKSGIMTVWLLKLHIRHMTICLWFFFNGPKWWMAQQWLTFLQSSINQKQRTCSHWPPGFYFADMSVCLQQYLWMTNSILCDQTATAAGVVKYY